MHPQKHARTSTSPTRGKTASWWPFIEGDDMKIKEIIGNLYGWKNDGLVVSPGSRAWTRS